MENVGGKWGQRCNLAFQIVSAAINQRLLRGDPTSYRSLLVFRVHVSALELAIFELQFAGIASEWNRHCVIQRDNLLEGIRIGIGKKELS